MFSHSPISPPIFMLRFILEKEFTDLNFSKPLPLYKFFLLVSTLQDILLVSTLQDILLVSTLSRYTFGFYPSRYTFGFYPSRYTFGFYLSLISRYTLVSTFQVLPLVTTLNSYFRLLYFCIIQFFTYYPLYWYLYNYFGLNSTI
ncbi:hypothetical protein H8356DRAFT_1325469 [Neocallimastix lanati (nom. inval.)]|nr:hypothetical protein H8356DRAFT_1325469 [Neocallimastix sp. JGI-2020a]